MHRGHDLRVLTAADPGSPPTLNCDFPGEQVLRTAQLDINWLPRQLAALRNAFRDAPPPSLQANEACAPSRKGRRAQRAPAAWGLDALYQRAQLARRAGRLAAVCLGRRSQAPSHLAPGSGLREQPAAELPAPRQAPGGALRHPMDRRAPRPLVRRSLLRPVGVATGDGGPAGTPDRRISRRHRHRVRALGRALCRGARQTDARRPQRVRAR